MERATVTRYLKSLPPLLLAMAVMSCLLPIKFSHCAFVRTIKTWNDENENGLLDEGELPLSDVEVVLTSQDIELSRTTDQEGEAFFNFAYRCGDSDEVLITPHAPEGYVFTTADSAQLLSTDTLNQDQPVLFGFALEE